ncbi:MAG: CDGSH iron-sulfur domain-containing protein [Planctomycetota bacterium]|nr:CDGSH iron-sulfur domain-containing protein [Planctomycetota bacterium]
MSDVTIRCRENGPLIVTGNVTLTDHEGNPYDTSDRENIALCRCGATRKRPFCDGTHRETGWLAADTFKPPGA